MYVDVNHYTFILTFCSPGNIIKAILRDFEEVKNAIARGNQDSKKSIGLKIAREIASSKLENEFPTEVERIQLKLQTPYLTTEGVNVIENQVKFLKTLMKMKQITSQAESIANGPRSPRRRALSMFDACDEPEVEIMKNEEAELLTWVMKERARFSDQELEDFNEELLRCRLMFSYLALKLEIRKRNISLSDNDTKCMDYVQKMLNGGQKVCKYILLNHLLARRCPIDE